MRVLNAVIYTDKLIQVRTYYEKYFSHLLMETNADKAFDLIVLGEARLTFIDAMGAGVAPSQNVLVRIADPFPELERARLVAMGLSCDPIVVEDWGKHYGKSAQSFIVTDPSGTRLQIFVDRYGETKQLMTVGDGRGTKTLQKAGE